MEEPSHARGLNRDSAELAEIYRVVALPSLQGEGIGAMLTGRSKDRAAASQPRHFLVDNHEARIFSRLFVSSNVPQQFSQQPI